MIHEFPIVFHSQGTPLVGRILRNTDSLYERQPGVIAIGSWLTVKEQMATTYARRFAELGFTAFVFDFAGFGESRGEPIRAEIPARKIADISAAAEFLRTLSFVDANRIGCVAVCASAQYALQSLADGAPIKSFASVAGWYHDPSSVAPFYGGDAGIKLRLERAHAALDTYLRTGNVKIVPAYKEGDDRAGMSFKLDYYALARRGAVPEWSNEMAEMTWLYWLSYDGLAAAPRVATPSIFVHADGCVFPDHVRQVHASLKGEKALAWGDGSQTDYYDLPAFVDTAVGAVRGWFDRTL
jgi:dienelactone hydrolase